MKHHHIHGLLSTITKHHLQLVNKSQCILDKTVVCTQVLACVALHHLPPSHYDTIQSNRNKSF